MFEDGIQVFDLGGYWCPLLSVVSQLNGGTGAA